MKKFMTITATGNAGEYMGTIEKNRFDNLIAHIQNNRGRHGFVTKVLNN